jgi:membrane protein
MAPAHDGVSRARAIGRHVVAVVRATVREALDDDLAGEAAKMAYFFFLSLFPLVLIVFAVTGIVGGDDTFARIAAVAETAIPAYAWQFVRDLIREITERERPGVLSIGIVLTLWAASNGIAALTSALNTIYDVPEGRGWWKRRGLAVVVLIVGTVMGALGAAIMASGVARLRGAGLGPLWSVARWPLGFALVTATIWLAYYFLPARDQRPVVRETAAGALAATTGWALATLLLSVYVTNVGRYGRTYGAIGAVIVLMIWFYITAFAVLLGGEVAAVLERRGRGLHDEAGTSGGAEAAGD